MHADLTRNLRKTIKSGKLEKTALPLCPAISLYLISGDYPKGRLDEDEMQAIMKEPAYWAFCWASGQVMAKHLLEHPQVCKDKSVLDLGSGSGVVAIAAAKCGAKRVIAFDIDSHALDASGINAELNGVTIELLSDLADLDKPVDLLIAADVLYDRDNLIWLETLADYAAELLIADSRIRDKKLFVAYESQGTVTASTIPDLEELKEFGHVSIYYRGPN